MKRLTLLLALILGATTTIAQTSGVAYRLRGGNLAQRPTTCKATAPADQYYAVDNDTEYVCDSPNHWKILATATIGGPGNVVGPASAVDNHLAVFDGTTGKLIKDGGAIPSATPAGSDTQVQFNDGGSVFGGDAGLLYNKTNDVLTETHTLGATSADGIVLQNPTAAAAGVQQWSPRLRFRGFGFNNDIEISRTADWIIENQPVQSEVGNPSTKLVFSSQVFAGGYTPRFVLDTLNGPTFPTLAGGGTQFLRVDNGGVVSGTASAGITNSAGPNVLMKSDGTNAVASQVTDDGDAVTVNGGFGSDGSIDANSSGSSIKIRGSSVSQLWLDATSVLGDAGMVGNSTNIAINDADKTIVANSGSESLAIDGTTHTITSVAATSFGINSPLVHFGDAAYQSCVALSTNASGNLICTASDARLKDVKSPFIDGLDAILKITPQTFTWKDARKEGLQAGLIAQDIQAAIPLAVSTFGVEREDGKLLQLDKDAILATLINAVKELKTIVDNQHAEIVALKKLLSKP